MRRRTRNTIGSAKLGCDRPLNGRPRRHPASMSHRSKSRAGRSFPSAVLCSRGPCAFPEDAANLDFVFAEERLDRTPLRQAMLGVNAPLVERLLGFEFDDRRLLAVRRDESLVRDVARD